MLWIHPKRQSESVKARRVAIRPGSILDVPKIVRVQNRDFEDNLNEYFRKQSNDVEMILAMASIYKVYREEGAVDLQSTQGKYLKHRHEKVVLDFVKENETHLVDLSRHVSIQ